MGASQALGGLEGTPTTLLGEQDLGLRCGTDTLTAVMPAWPKFWLCLSQQLNLKCHGFLISGMQLR
jgi:hypothetical protein